MNHEEPIQLDYRGLRCPLPVIRTRKALRSVNLGRLAVILSDDSSAPADFKAFCDVTGHELIDVKENNGVFEIRLRAGRRQRRSSG